MKRFRKRRVSIEHIVLLLILFIIQMIWIYIMVTHIFEAAPWIDMILTVLSMFTILYLIIKDESPAYRLSWTILIGLFPVFGMLTYIFMGNKRPIASMRHRLENQQAIHADEYQALPDAYKKLKEKDPRLAALSNYLYHYADAPVYTDTQVDYYPNGESMMPALLEDLKKAKKTIFMEFFIVDYGEMLDQIMEILAERVQAGVDVRFMYDDFGCITRLPADFIDKLNEIGIKGMKFNPMKPILSMVYNTRDHRKYIIIDSEVAYTGGLNIADEYINAVTRFGYWKDNMIRIEGPAVWNITNLFLNMWNAFKPTEDNYDAYYPKALIEEEAALIKEDTTGEKIDELGFVQPFGDSPLDSEPIGENVYRDILNLAQDYVYIYTPYLVISYELQTAMQLAAKRGVDVRLMTPGIPDKKLVFRMTRSYYRPLLDAGIKIYEYSPGFLHAKTFIADDKIAAVGTINLDYRSLYLHFETSTLMYYHQVIKDIKEDYMQSCAVSKEISISDTRSGLIGTMIDAVLRLLAPFV